MENIVIQDVWMVLQVVLIDLALGGDNSIVIGMAAKNLAPNLQKKAILYGTAGAIVMRFLMALAVVWLLQIPYLKTVGGLLLVLIGIKLIGNQDKEESIHIKSKDTLLGAVETIIIADALMSLDNVLGIVGATNGHLMLLAFGMFISVPIIIFGSTIVIKVMNRFSWLIYVGGAILGWAAGGMLASDPYLPFAAGNGGMIKIILTLLTIAGGYILKHWSSFKKS